MINSQPLIIQVWSKPYPANKSTFFAAIHEKLSLLLVDNTSNNLLSYKSHLSLNGLQKLFPDHHRATINQLIYNGQVAAALADNLPAPLMPPADENLPKPIPVLPVLPGVPTQISFQIYKLQMDTYNSYNEKVIDFRNFIKTMLNEETIQGLEALGGINGITT